jgi:hypothetical protein
MCLRSTSACGGSIHLRRGSAAMPGASMPAGRRRWYITAAACDVFLGEAPVETTKLNVGLRAGQRQKTRLDVVVAVELDPCLKIWVGALLLACHPCKGAPPTGHKAGDAANAPGWGPSPPGAGSRTGSKRRTTISCQCTPAARTRVSCHGCWRARPP